MRLVICDDYNKLSEWAAKYVRNRILKSQPGPDNYFVLGLPTGTVFSFSWSAVSIKKWIPAQELVKLT